MSDYQKVLALQNIMPYLSQNQQTELAKTLGMDIEEVSKRLVGKNKEDEFILILLFMNVCKSITGFDEGLSQLLQTATSDLLIELKNGEKFMLEIKHTDKEKYSISSGNLNKRIEYAKQLGFELFFAISIKGFWMLFNSTYLKNKNGKIDISDYKNSELDKKLECLSYMFPKGIKIKSVYSKMNKKSIGIKFEPYGHLISYELYYKNKKIFRVKGTNSPYKGYSMILEALQDRLSMDQQTIVKDGDYTIITEEFTEDFNCISEYKFLLAPIEHTVYDSKNRYTHHIYIEQLKSDRNLLKYRFTLEHIRGMIQYLANNDVDIKYIKDKKIYKVQKLL